MSLFASYEWVKLVISNIHMQLIILNLKNDTIKNTLRFAAHYCISSECTPTSFLQLVKAERIFTVIFSFQKLLWMRVSVCLTIELYIV